MTMPSSSPLNESTAAPRSSAYLAMTAEKQVRTRSNLELSARRFLRHRLAMFGLIITLALLVMGLMAPWIAPFPYDYSNLMTANSFPSRDHLFGTDAIGRQ